MVATVDVAFRLLNRLWGVPGPLGQGTPIGLSPPSPRGAPKLPPPARL